MQQVKRTESCRTGCHIRTIGQSESMVGPTSPQDDQYRSITRPRNHSHVQIDVCPFHRSANRRQARTHDRLCTFELILSNDLVGIETECGSSESRTTERIVSARRTFLHRSVMRHTGRGSLQWRYHKSSDRPRMADHRMVVQGSRRRLRGCKSNLSDHEHDP